MQITTWAAAAQALKPAAHGCPSHGAKDISRVCQAIALLPAVQEFPANKQRKQQEAFEQLLSALLPQALANLLDISARSRGWEQQECYTDTLKRVLTALQHVSGLAGIDHEVDQEKLPLLASLAQQWQSLLLLPKLAVAMQHLVRAMQHPQQQGTPQPAQDFQLPYMLAYTWVTVDTVLDRGRTYPFSQGVSAAQAAAALVMAAAQRMQQDTPAVYFSILLDVCLRLLYNPAYGDCFLIRKHHYAFSRPAKSEQQLCGSPAFLQVLLLLLVVQSKHAIAAQHFNSSSSKHGNSGGGSGFPGPKCAAPGCNCSITPSGVSDACNSPVILAITQQQLHSLNNNIQAIWQQLGLAPELLPLFEAAMEPKHQFQYTGLLCWDTNILLALRGAAGGFACVAAQLRSFMACSQASAPWASGSTAAAAVITSVPQRGVSAQQPSWQLWAAVAQHLPGLLLGVVSTSDQKDSGLQWVALETAGQIVCTWEGIRSAGQLDGLGAPTGATASNSAASAAGTAAGHAAAGETTASGIAAAGVQWQQATVQESLHELLQNWCRCMEAQLVLAQQQQPSRLLAPNTSGHPVAAAGRWQGSTGGSSGAGSCGSSATGPGEVTRERLDTISHLLTLLTEVSKASASWNALQVWDGWGTQVLRLLEQYVRTVLAYLHMQPLQPIKHDASNPPGQRTWFPVGPSSDMTAGWCPCCWDKPGVEDAAQHRQFLHCCNQLLAAGGSRSPSPMFEAARRAGPGSLVQQQLLSLLVTMQKRWQGCLVVETAADVYNIMGATGAALQLSDGCSCCVQQPRAPAGPPPAAVTAAAAATATAAVQAIVLRVRHAAYLSKVLQQLRADAAGAVQQDAVQVDGGGRSHNASSAAGRQGSSSSSRRGSRDRGTGSSGSGSSGNSMYDTHAGSKKLSGQDAVETLKAFHSMSAISYRVWSLVYQDLLALAGTEETARDALHKQLLQNVQHAAAGQQQQHMQLVCYNPHQPQLEEEVMGFLHHLAALFLVAETAYKRAVGCPPQRARPSVPALFQAHEHAYMQNQLARPLVTETAALAAARTLPGCLQVLLSCPELQQVPQQLQALGHRLCAALPVATACNNPACSNLGQSSELQLVQGKGSKCSGCRVARYCSKSCQTEHWKAHKAVCKALAANRASMTAVEDRVHEAAQALQSARSCLAEAEAAAQALLSPATAQHILAACEPVKGDLAAAIEAIDLAAQVSEVEVLLPAAAAAGTAASSVRMTMDAFDVLFCVDRRMQSVVAAVTDADRHARRAAVAAAVAYNAASL